MKNNIALIGMPCSGKTSTGKIIAQKTNKHHLDMDDFIQDEYGICSIKLLLESNGETYFREIEEIALKKIIQKYDNFVLSTGGGTVLSGKNRTILKKNFLNSYLFTNQNLLRDRLKNDSSRPHFLYKNLDKIFICRSSLYEETSDLKIACRTMNQNELSDVIISKANEQPCKSS